VAAAFGASNTHEIEEMMISLNSKTLPFSNINIPVWGHVAERLLANCPVTRKVLGL
jgi:hypothetical protein